ncbi:helix-turn-helix domain-containing protein [Paenibacillus humicola]|uniref:helix-turn-helix domain-containing protein n=1 Tax=Paenibacillus humicola TaxID=3110540 RepID=UPI00237A36BB|nr:AraC family transcriptional regulator [Paenibacillus humicola]
MTVSPLKENTFIPDRTFPINVFIVSNVGMHWHDHIEWIYVRKGRARIQIDAVYEQLGEGELAFVNSRQLHSVVTLTPDAELVCIVFNEALVRGSGLDITEHHYFLPYLNQRFNWPSTMKRGEASMAEMSESIERAVGEFKRKEPGYELLVKAELLRIFGQYFRYAQTCAARPMPQVRRSHDLSHLLQTLRSRYDSPPGVEEAAALVGLSPNHFCKVFKQVTGKTLLEYIHLLRVQEAERLLLDTDMPVTEIAGRIGYSNMTYFGRVFKKMKGATPSEIRKRGAAPPSNERRPEPE